MKIILEALKICEENELFDENIRIALGLYKLPTTIKEGLYNKKLENGKN